MKGLFLSLVALIVVAGLAVGVGVYLVRSRPPIHADASAVPSSGDAPIDAKYAASIDEARTLARTIVARDNLPGLSVAVAVDGEIAWAEGFGWADLGNRRPVTPLTRFRLGALSKPVTALAAARLSEKGALDLDAPVQRYVRGYPAKAWTLTTRQLLADVGGVHRIRGDDNDAMPQQRCDTLDDAVALLAGEPLQFQPGTEHRYSIWGWTLVSAVVQGAGGHALSQVMAREVFQPLGMTRTLVEEPADLADTAHTGPAPDYSCLAGGGAFVSTPTDLARLGSAMLKPGFLRADTIDAFRQPTRLASGEVTTYALGWTVRMDRIRGASTRVVSHRGSPFDGSAALLTFPDLGVAVAATANAGDSSRVSAFARQAAELFASYAPAAPDGR